MKFKCRALLPLKNLGNFDLISFRCQFIKPYTRIYKPVQEFSSSPRTFVSVTATQSADVKSPEIIFETEQICKILSNLRVPETVDSALDSAGVEISPIIVQEVLKKLTNSGFLALSFFRWADKQKRYNCTPEGYHALIEALGKIKQFKMVWNLVDEMRQQGILSKDTFSLISRRYARAKKVKEAVDAFKKMENFGFTPELQDYNRLLDTLSKSRQVKKAQQVFDEWKKRKFTPDIKSYTILLEGWGQEQNFLRLNEVYREMSDDGFEPDVVTFGIIITAYCRAKTYDKAIELYHEMESKSIQATPYIYCSLINGLGSEKRLQEALKFFELAIAAGQQHIEAPTYNAVIGAYCWSMQFPSAFQVVDEMKRLKIGPNSRTYDILINHLIKARRSKEAYDIFLKMGTESGCEPTVSTYEIIIRMFCKEGKSDIALNVWNHMKNNGVLPGMHMFSTLINALSFEKKLDDAFKHFNEMLDMGIRPPLPLFNNLKQALLDQGKDDDVAVLQMKLEKLWRTQIVG